MKLVWGKTDQPNEWLANNHPELFLIRFIPETSDGGHFTLFRLRGRGAEYIISARERKFCENRAQELVDGSGQSTAVSNTERYRPNTKAFEEIPTAKFERPST